MVLHSPKARRTSPTRLVRASRKQRHLQLIDPKDGAEILPDSRVYTNDSLTPWNVIIKMDDPVTFDYDASFRLDGEDGEEDVCTVFTLTLRHTTLYALQIRIWPNNEVVYESHAPVIVHVQPRRKSITIRMLATVKSVPEGIEVVYT